MKYEKCPNCNKKGLHHLAYNDYNILMRREIESECKYCGYTKEKFSGVNNQRLNPLACSDGNEGNNLTTESLRRQKKQ